MRTHLIHTHLFSGSRRQEERGPGPISALLPYLSIADIIYAHFTVSQLLLLLLLLLFSNLTCPLTRAQAPSSNLPCSNTRILLKFVHSPPVLLVGKPLPPFLTHSVLLFYELRGEFDLVFVLPDLQCKPRRGVPSDMTMHDPDPRVVSPEADRQIPIPGQQGDITAGGIIVLESAIF